MGLCHVPKSPPSHALQIAQIAHRVQALGLILALALGLSLEYAMVAQEKTLSKLPAGKAATGLCCLIACM